MTMRGEPLPINQAMNRSRAKLGLELGTWMVIAFVSVTVSLQGFMPLPFSCSRCWPEPHGSPSVNTQRCSSSGA